MKTIYILMSDDDGTMWSGPQLTGESVATEEEAKKWAAEADYPGQRTYQEVRIQDDKS